MKSHLKIDMQPYATQSRQGATLTEVMVAILIMGIGMVGVISLFPAAVLRSVHGNTLTVGTGLRFNAESMLRIHPELLLDPDRNLAAEPAPFQATDRNHNGFRYDDQAFSSTAAMVSLAAPVAPQGFMLDPLGVINHAPAIVDGDPVCTLPGPPLARMQRFTAGYTTVATAEEIFSGLDQWTTQYEAFPINGNLDPAAASQSLTFSDLSQRQIFLGLGLAPTRLVIFNRAGTGCQIRDLPAPAAPVALTNTVTWNNANLPGAYSNVAFANADIGNVRVEQRDLKFTWLMTARGRTTEATSNAPEFLYDVDMVVFYKRGYAPGDIVGFANSLAAAPNFVFNVGSKTAVVTWTPGPTAAPFLKRGGYVLDAQNGFWYRIEEYIEGPDNATITLATPARANSQLAVFCFYI